MPREITRDAKYGAARIFYFELDVPAGTDPDRFFDNVSPLVAGDAKVSIDAGAFANVTNLPTRVDRWKFQWSATAGELTGTDIQLAVVDQTTPPVFRDLVINIETKKRLGQVDVDASPIGGAAAALLLKAAAGGFGLEVQDSAGAIGQVRGLLASHLVRVSTLQAGAAGSVTLDAGASAINDFYKDCRLLVISGVGVAQFRTISAYDGTTKIASVSRNFNTNPAVGAVAVVYEGADVWDTPEGTQPSAMIPDNASFRQIQQLVKRRRFNKNIQNATQQIVYKDDSSTQLAARNVSDDGTTQTQQKYT